MIQNGLRATIFGLILVASACTSSKNGAAISQSQPSALKSEISFSPAVTVPYLASDALEGRGIGTHGLDLAADYLADHFRAAGVKPLPGMTGYFQPFDYTAASLPAPDCSLVVNGQALKLDQDYRPLTSSGQGAFSGLVVFAGYGITSKAHDYDDYAGLDVRGRVVLVMRFEPMNAAGKSMFAPPGMDYSAEAGLRNKIENATAHGAAGLLLFTPAGLESSDPLLGFGRDSSPIVGAIPAIHIKRSAAKLILGEDLKLTQDSTGKPAVKLSENFTASGLVHVEQTVLHLKNVVGMIPGAGPHADEYVVVGAHYDHLGRGKYGGMFGPPGSIFHGADDNASGSATVLALAYHAGKAAPRARTIVFCLFTAEEEGLIGSEYFVKHSPIDLSKVAAMFNMDMVGRVKDETVYVGGGGTAKDLDAIAQAADAGQPLKLHPLAASVGGRGGMGPSDHMEFALNRIPIVFLYSGMHADYHRPTDTSDKINYAGIEEVVSLGDRLIDGLAAMPREPYDSTADMRGMGLPGNSSGDHLSGAALGVVPDYTTETNDPGVLIQGVRPSSAAEKAGLQAGDVILQFNEKKLVGLADLADALAMAHGGDKVALTVRRGKETLVLHATLESRG